MLVDSVAGSLSSGIVVLTVEFVVIAHDHLYPCRYDVSRKILQKFALFVDMLRIHVSLFILISL